MSCVGEGEPIMSQHFLYGLLNWKKESEWDMVHFDV